MAVVRTAFYATLQVTARDGADRATAIALLHAEPPANRLATPLNERVAARTGVSGFALAEAPDAAESNVAPIVPLSPAHPADVVAALRPIAPRQPEAIVQATERARRRGALALAIAFALFLAGEWRPGLRLRSVAS